MKTYVTIILLMTVSILYGMPTKEISIIPRPVELTPKTGTFTIDTKTSLIFDNCNPNDVHLFIDQLKKVSGLTLSTKKHIPTKNYILFKINPSLLDRGTDYHLINITPHSIVIEGASTSALFYATQSLRQLLPTAFESNKQVKNIDLSLPCLEIIDYPRYDWRGYMKDVSRTFYSTEVIKKYLDVMALYKLNVFHFHLTDDQGWRIEIKKYPELTSAIATTFDPVHHQPSSRSGYFSQDEIREIIAYANERHIRIVPEIDVPGHCWPVILVKPELGTNQTVSPNYLFPFNDSWGYWGQQFTPNPLDPTKESVYTFLGDVFAEVASLFPGEYIHFGGDEVVHRLWASEPHIQEFMKDKGMTKIEQLQSYFVQRVSSIIENNGKKPIGWNDILADAESLPKSTAIMSWLGQESVKQAAKHGLYTVASPSSPLYFDITQQSRHDGTMSDLNYGAINSLDRVYHYDPEKGLTPEEKQYVLGIQANMWPAVPQELKDINVQNFPRLLALAESAWTTNERKDFKSFEQRLDHHYGILDSLKIDYFRDGGYIIGHWTPQQIDTVDRIVSWDITDAVYAPGRAQAGFFFTKGDSFLKIKNVKILCDDIVIAEDNHPSIADKFRGIPFKKDMFLYQFDIKDTRKGIYTLQAEISGVNSKDSYGNVTFNVSPYENFKYIENKKNLH